jgi:hypothetical protein
MGMFLGSIHMVGLLRSTIDCIAGTVLPFLINIIKYDCVPSQRTDIIAVYITSISLYKKNVKTEKV